jgi:hypothetical protein
MIDILWLPGTARPPPGVSVRAQQVLPLRPRRRLGRGGRRLAVTTLLLGLAVGAGVPAAAGASAAGPDAWSSSQGGSANGFTNPGESLITATTAARVRKAWSVTERMSATAAPAVVGTTVYFVDNPRSTYEASTFVAASTTTGQVLWSTALPAGQSATVGLAVSGRYAVVPYIRTGAPGGLTAVDLTARKVAWSSPLPPSSISWMSNWQAGTVVTDATRAYVPGSSNGVNTYRLTDGKLLWTAPLTTNPANGTPNGVEGLATDGTTLFTGSNEGLVALDPATGRRLWTALGDGRPVVAGGRVFSSLGNQVVAVGATGCGRPTCPVQWTWRAPGALFGDLLLGPADASTVVVTYTQEAPSGSSAAARAGTIVRLNASTGAVERTISTGSYLGQAVRGGDTLWVVSEYWNAQKVDSYRLLGFAASGTRTTPLKTIELPAELHGFPQSLAIGGGTLFQQNWNPARLTGYRVG